MKFNKWTVGLAAVGLVSLASAVNADEKQNYLQTALSSTTISGYIDTSFEMTTWKEPENTTPVSFRGGKNDGFNLNVVELTLEKPLDESAWASGYKVQLLYGPDAVGYNASPGAGTPDVGIKQAYVNLRTPVGNGIEWKIGVFDTIIGYEVFEAGSNPNFSRSFGYGAEPTQHTGILASYRINDIISVQAGIANTLVSGINARNANAAAGGYAGQNVWDKTYMGSVALTAPQSWGWAAGSTLYIGDVYGYNGAAGGWDNSAQNNLYVGLTLNTPVAGLKTGFAWDHVYNIGVLPAFYGAFAAPSANLVNHANVDTFAWYGSYQATSKMSLHARAEYAMVENRNTGLRNASTSALGLTGTLQYDLWQNVLSRLEIRWDSVTDGDLYGAKAASGNEVGTGLMQNSFVSVYANIIYKF